MKITVLVPTYRRTQDLDRCIEALKQQISQPSEVLVIVRDSDTDTWAFLQTKETAPLNLRTVCVSIPGQVAALNAGVDAAQGDVLAITDDDAAPHADWLKRIEAHFLANDRVGGVGGRDWMYLNGELQDASVHPGASKVVGQLQWFGRAVGNHHIGEGQSREVDILKGANMSYRKSAIAGVRFDEALLGTGAQVHNDLAFSLAVKRNGWKLIYDPKVEVDHYLSRRFDEDQRTEAFNEVACRNAAHNETFVLLKHLPPGRRIVFFLWSTLLGTRSLYGFVNMLRFLPQEKTLAIQKWRVAMGGRWHGCRSWKQSVF